MSDIEFNCPKCKKLLVVDEQGSGRLIKCPDCRCSLMIPRRRASSPTTPPPPPVTLPPPPVTPAPPPVTPPPPPVIPAPPVVQTPLPAVATPVIKCPKCGTELPKSEARFCMTCGTMLKRPDPAPDTVRHEQIAQSFREKKSKLLDNRYASASDPTPEAQKKVEAPVVCPYCGHGLTPDAVICVACGRNLRSGRSLSRKKRNPLVILGRFFTFILGFIEILGKAALCVVLVIVIIWAGSTFFKEEPASTDKAAPPAAGQPQGPTEIMGVTELLPAASTNSLESGTNVTEATAVSATNSVPEKPVVEAPAVIAKPPVEFQEEELNGIVNTILTSWRDHTQEYEKHLIIGYSGGQVTSPITWQIRSVQRDRKNPDDLLITVFVRNATPKGKTYSAEWTFKFRLENNMWRLAKIE